MKKNSTPEKRDQKPKADPDKEYDVLISVIHDNRKGISQPIEKSTRFSFATMTEALEFANKLKETK